MNAELKSRFDGFSGYEGATPDAVAKIKEAFGVEIPDELSQILLGADGMGGVISGHVVQFWSCREIIDYNRANQVQKYCPSFLMFGSDGGGETYTLDYRSNPPSVVLVAAVGFDYESAILIGRDFLAFLDRLIDSRSLFDS